MTDDWAAFRSLEERVLEHNSRIEQLSPAISNRSFESPRSEVSQNSLIKSQMNKIIKLSKSLNEKELELSEAKRELGTFKRLREENISLKSQLTLLTEKVASAEREVQFKNRALSEQELKLKDLNCVESELGYSNRQRDALCHELDSLHNALKRSELAEEQLASEVRQRLQAEERAAILQEQVNCNHTKMSAYSRGLEEQLREVEIDNAQLKTELGRTASIIDKCQAEFNSLDSLRSELRSKSERMHSVTNELERERKTIQKLLREKEALEYRLSEIASKADGADPVALLTRLKSKLGETQDLHATAAQEASQLETRVKASENKLRLLRRAVRVRLETLTSWIDEHFLTEGEGLSEGVNQDQELAKYWNTLEIAIMKAKNIGITRTKELEKRLRIQAKNTEKIEEVAMKLKMQLEHISAKVDGHERLGVKVQELERQTKSRGKIASDWESKFVQSQRKVEDLSKEHDEVGRILEPLLGDYEDRKTLKSMAKSVASILTKQKSIISESQYRLEELRKEIIMLRDQFSDERHRNEETSQELNSQLNAKSEQLDSKDKLVAAKEADLKKLLGANRELQDEVQRLQADIGGVKEDRERIKDLSYLHYKTCVALLRVLMPALQNMSELAAQKALCSNTLYKLEAEIKHFSGSFGLSSSSSLFRVRVVGSAVRAIVRLKRSAKRYETIKYNGITLKISPIVPEMPTLPYGDNDQHLIYSLLLSAERSFPRTSRVELPSVTANIDGLKRVFSLARDHVELSSSQASSARQQLGELIKEKQADLSTISGLKEKLTKLQFSLTEQSTEFATIVKSYAEAKVRNEELEASLTLLQLNTEAISEQLILIRNQYTELLADNDLKAKHLEVLQESHDRLLRELDESEDARMCSETERNELLQKEGMLSEEVMRLTEALEALRERLE